MMHVGEALGDLLWHGGWLSRVVLALGVLGLALSLGCTLVLLAWRRAARAAGVVTLLVAAGAMGLAAAGAQARRAEADRAADAADLAPRRERLRRDGYTEARVVALGGLVLGAFPLIAGTAAVLAGGGARRRAGARARRGDAPGAGGASPGQGVASGGWTVPVALGAAALGAALALLAARAEIPGRELDKAAWEVLEHEAQIEAGRMEEGCSGLERDLRSLGPAEAAPIARDMKALAAACIGHRLAQAGKPGTVERAARAESLARESPLVLDESTRARLRGEQGR